MHRPTAAALIAALILLSACIPPPPRVMPEPFSSPLAAPPAALYLPLAPSNPHWGKGAALTYSSRAPCDQAASIDAAWLYNWTATPPDCAITAFPLVWSVPTGGACPELPAAPLILLWNEPSWFSSTGPLDPALAAQSTHFLTEECYPARAFASPAEISTDTYDGLIWMAAYWQAYRGLYGAPPRLEVMAHHCYTWRGAQTCIERLDAAARWALEHGMRGVLVTELAVIPSVIGHEQARAEADRLLEWLQQDARILGYAYFATVIFGSEAWAFRPHPAATTSLLDPVTLALTPLGAWYAAEP